MIQDIVIDTNVLAHAGNKQESKQQDCIDFINYLLDSSEVMRVDEGFTLSETTNKSYMAYEYLKHLKHGDLGYLLIVSLAQSKRLIPISAKVPIAAAKKINQHMSNNHDRVFLRVAFNSENKILVSHDFTDFSKTKRNFYRKQLGVQILIASEYEKIPVEEPTDEEE